MMLVKSSKNKDFYYYFREDIQLVLAANKKLNQIAIKKYNKGSMLIFINNFCIYQNIRLYVSVLFFTRNINIWENLKANVKSY